jgi:Tfp pilus assembly protein PilX
MFMIHASTVANRIAQLRARLAGEEDGFTMILALAVLTVTTLLVTASFVALSGNTNLTRHDLDAKRAYYAARAGENAFLYQLDQDPEYWTTCSNDYHPTPLPVPGVSTGETYSFVPVYNSGYSNSTCNVSNSIAALIDSSSGTLRMEFTGYSGTHPQVSRTIVTSFRKASPLDYLWYTDHETKDPLLDSVCAGVKYYYQYTSTSPPGQCQINWVSGDTMSGPLYTNDQYLIYPSASPVFGRAGSNDQTQSSVPKSFGICVKNNCQNAKFQGQGAVPGADPVALPSAQTAQKLLTDAQLHGIVFQGTTTINLNSTTGTETITNCPSGNSATACTVFKQAQASWQPIIYVQSMSGCPSTYALDTTYSTNSQGQYYGPCGDVYVTGTYSQPLTIASDHDIIILANNGSSTGVQTDEDSSGNPTGSATLGLVAADNVRVMHSATVFASPVTIDAAILTLSHSFMVDNYDTKASSNPPKLTVHGAIAQRYRGIVGTSGGTGYLKNYHYDDRLQVLLPPYLFDIAISAWKIVRETLCTPGGATGSC